MTSHPSARPGPPRQVRIAGCLVALQGALALVFAGALVVRSGSTRVRAVDVLGEAGFFLVVGAALAFVGFGLVTGRRWARTPAIVTQLLLLPVVYSLLGPSRQLALGIAAGAVVFAAFMLLISEPARRWWTGLDEPAEHRE
ncbi:MAG TPA: hypothetical protein VM367_15550 [Pseudonocardia sp.]|nr:hypothetical protein [Pseudonocardia sp.]